MGKRRPSVGRKTDVQVSRFAAVVGVGELLNAFQCRILFSSAAPIDAGRCFPEERRCIRMVIRRLQFQNRAIGPVGWTDGVSFARFHRDHLTNSAFHFSNCSTNVRGRYAVARNNIQETPKNRGFLKSPTPGFRSMTKNTIGISCANFGRCPTKHPQVAMR